MLELSLDVTHVYNFADGIEIPLIISFGGKEVQITGDVDSGAEACIFSNEIGQMLGIDVEACEPESFGPASGVALQTYGYLVIIEFLGITFYEKAGQGFSYSSRVGKLFFADTSHSP